MKITTRQLRQLIREALKHDDVDWQRLQTMRSSDVQKLPADQQRLAQVMMSARDPSGRDLGLRRADSASAKIFELLEALRDSENPESWDAAAAEILKSCDEFSKNFVKSLTREIDSNLGFCARKIGDALGIPSYEFYKSYINEHWDTIKDWAFRRAMVGPTVRTHNLKTGRDLFPDAQLLQTDIDDEVRLVVASSGM